MASHFFCHYSQSFSLFFFLSSIQKTSFLQQLLFFNCRNLQKFIKFTHGNFLKIWWAWGDDSTLEYKSNLRSLKSFLWWWWSDYSVSNVSLQLTSTFILVNFKIRKISFKDFIVTLWPWYQCWQNSKFWSIFRMPRSNENGSD